MARKRKEEGDVASVDLAALVPEEAAPADGPRPAPGRSSPEWQQYVMGQFAPEELRDGKPLAHGLLRVVELLMGPVVQSVSRVVVPPDYDDQGRLKRPVVCEHHVRILAPVLENGRAEAMDFEAVADLHELNCDRKFVRNYATATCSTRAKSRALRDALGLQTCSADEVGGGGDATCMDDDQAEVIDVKCRQLGLDAWALVNKSSRGPFASSRAVPRDVASRLIEQLNLYQQGASQPPAGCDGYKDNWRK